MTRLLILGVILVLFDRPARAQVETVKRMLPSAPRDGVVHRDADFEKTVLDRATKLAAVLTAAAKQKLDAPIKLLSDQVGLNPVLGDPGRIARLEVARRFSGTTAEQTDLLNFYVLAEVLRRVSPQTPTTDEGAGQNELAEAIAERQQMALDRRSKLMAALAASMKKIAATPDTAVKDLH